MRTFSHTLGGAAVAGMSLLLLACGANPPPASMESGFIAPEGRSARTTGVILRGGILRRGGAVLDVMNGRVMNMEITRRGPCPQVRFRGISDLRNSSDPQVYVDDSPAANTCILEAIRAEDVQRIEVYASGNAGRSGIMNHPYGIILIYMRTAVDD